MPNPKRLEHAPKNRIALDRTLDALSGLSIEVVEKGRRAWPTPYRLRHKDTIREFVVCHNPLCQGGGFSLGDVIRELVHSRQEDFIGTNFCIGQEEIVGGTQSCRTRFEITAHLRFRNT